MEREGEGREGEKMRRGSEKKRGRRGIIVGGMVLSLLMGCNNGIAELENKNKFLTSISNLGKGFLDVFVTFGDMVTGAFGINAETKKSEVGKYFTDIAKTMETVKTKLRDEVSKNGNYERVKKVVDEFIAEKLDKIAEGAREAAKGAGDTESLGNMTASNVGGTVGVGEVDKLINGIKTIMGVVDLKEGKHDAGDNNKASDGNSQRTATDAGILFANNNAGSTAKTAATDAAKAVGSVSGADILQAIAIGDNGDAVKLAKYNAANGNAGDGKKDAVIAGGIALRAMAKDGKFAGQSGADSAVTIVKNAAASAVNKTLSTLVIAIRNTVNSGLKTINEALTAVKQGEISAEKSEGAAK